MKNFYLSLLLVFGTAASARAQNIVNITDNDLIAGQTYNWVNTNTYVLDGMVFVESGAKLNIQAGTVVKFTDGTPASALVICRGAQIFAEGTPTQPIIFTSVHDNLNGNLGPEDNAMWGGLVILGNGVTVRDGNSTPNVEGIPTTEPRGQYGGTNNADNSGVLKYVSIRHAGREIAPDNELQNLTLGAVGSGTKIEYIEIFASSDDGIEWFGGAVDVKYAIVAFAEDDCWDFDETWTGRGQFWFSIQRDDIADAGIEGDGSTPDDVPPPSDPAIFNLTHIGSGQDATTNNNIGWLLRAGTKGLLANSICYDTKGRGLEVQDKGGNSSTDAYSRLVAGELRVVSNVFYKITANNNMEMNVGANGILRVRSGADFPDADAVVSHLADNHNMVADPGIRGVSRTDDKGLDPRPSATGAAYTGTLAPLERNTDGFFTQVNYRGAFSAEENGLAWMAGWTKLHTDGYIDMPVSVAPQPLARQVAVYPNPANSIVYVKAANGQRMNIAMYSVSGALVDVKNSFNGGAVEVNVSGLSSGLYLLKVSDASGSFFTQKVIVE